MTGLPLIFVFILAIVAMILMISKFKIHPFVSIMCISLILGVIAGIPLVDTTLEDGTVRSGLANVIGSDHCVRGRYCICGQPDAGDQLETVLCDHLR